MKLEVNTSHKKANLIGRKLVPRIGALVLGTALTISSFAIPAEAAELDQTHSDAPESGYTAVSHDMDEVQIDDFNLFSVGSALNRYDDGPVTVRDLQGIEDYLMIKVKPDENLDLSWLNYCTNLKSAMIIGYGSFGTELANIKGFDKLERVSISVMGNDTLDSESFDFLKRCPNLKHLSLLGMSIDADFLSKLTSLRELSIYFQNDIEVELDYSKLTYLSVLDFSTTKPYDIAVNFSMKDYEILTSAGVEVKGDFLDQALEIDKELEDITNSLPITDDMTDEEKLDQVLIYVLERLSYDAEISEALRTNTDHEKLTQSFYSEGALYGALAKDSSICGNYSALVDALLYRLGMKSAIVLNDTHAWNLVKVEGEYYYVDSTFLDGEHIFKESEAVSTTLENGSTQVSYSYESVPASEAIKTGDVDDLRYRMFDPNKSIDEHHEGAVYPSYIDVTRENPEPSVNPENLVPIKDAEETKNETEEEAKTHAEDITDKKFKIKLGKKEYIIGGAVLVGLLGGCGAAYGIHKKKEEEKRRRRMREAQMWDYDPYAYHPYR